MPVSRRLVEFSRAIACAKPQKCCPTRTSLNSAQDAENFISTDENDLHEHFARTATPERFRRCKQLIGRPEFTSPCQVSTLANETQTAVWFYAPTGLPICPGTELRAVIDPESGRQATWLRLVAGVLCVAGRTQDVLRAAVSEREELLKEPNQSHADLNNAFCKKRKWPAKFTHTIHNYSWQLAYIFTHRR